MNFALISFLENRLREPLPGREAHFRMAHLNRREFLTDRFIVPSDAKIAAVLLLLFWKNEGWNVVLIERTSRNPNDRHGGQISFPGGKMEPTDASLAVAALRETEEEIGVWAEKMRVLGSLTPLYIPVSRFLVHPFVGVLEGESSWIPQKTEVEQVFEVPLAWLQNPAARGLKDLPIQQVGRLKDVPFFDVFGKTVWGATAMILNEFLEILAMRTD